MRKPAGPASATGSTHPGVPGRSWLRCRSDCRPSRSTQSAGAATTSRSARSRSGQSSQAAAIADIVRTAITTDHLRAVIVKVTKGDKVITTQAFGPSLTGEPATTDMYFRNGAVAFEYLTTLLMEFVDEHKVKLDDTIQRWQPNLPDADKVTLKMLANQTTGYPDFETDDTWTNIVQRRPLPGAVLPVPARLRVPPPDAVRARHELELRAHELHDPRRDPLPDREEAAPDAPAAEGAAARWV